MRLRRDVTAVLGPLYPQNHNVVQMDITYDCNLKCTRCGRQCAQAPSKDRITVDQVRKFVEESVAQDRKWRMLRMMGGEPSLHPELDQILDLLRHYRDTHSPATILRLETNGFGPRVQERLAAVPDDVVVLNSGKKTRQDPEFVQFNAAPVDFKQMRVFDYVNGCPNKSMCGLGFTPYGYYVCGSAGGIDRVFGFDVGSKTLPARGDMLNEQTRKLCAFCGFFWSSINLRINMSAEELSPSWRRALGRYKQRHPVLTPY
jgi:hypothetical protein